MLHPRRTETLSTQLWKYLISNWTSGQIRYTSPWSRTVLWTLWVAWLVRFPTFYRTQSFITLFKIACHLSLCCAIWTQPCPPTLFLSYLFVHYPPIYMYLLSHAFRTSSSLIDHKQCWRGIWSLKLLIMQFYLVFLTSFVVQMSSKPYFWDILSSCSSLDVWDQVVHSV